MSVISTFITLSTMGYGLIRFNQGIARRVVFVVDYFNSHK